MTSPVSETQGKGQNKGASDKSDRASAECARIITLSVAAGDFVTGPDGCVVWWPEGFPQRGALNAWHLRALADELDRRNADWCAQMDEFFAAQAPQGCAPTPSGDQS